MTEVPTASTAYRPPGARGKPVTDIFTDSPKPRFVPGQKQSTNTKITAQTIQLSQQPIPDLILVDQAQIIKEKKIKICIKKLKQIEGLKMKLKNGESLELTQTMKIANEDAVRTELDNLHL